MYQTYQRTLRQYVGNQQLAIRIALIVLFAVLTAVGALVKIELNGVVPFTMQVFVVMLAGLTLGAKDAAASQITYLTAATLGAPITAGGVGGPAIWLKPTAGYLVGFVLGALITGLLTEWGSRRSVLWCWIASFAAMLPIYALGWAWLTLTIPKPELHGNWAATWGIGVAPFLLIDAVKAALAAVIATGENFVYRNQQEGKTMPIALLSVSDKTGLVDFAQGLHALGWQLLASGGSANTLRQAGLPVREVADYTQSPEILGGRVKTLHPAVHGGILAQDTPAALAELQALGWGYIDLVAVNLYPFEQTIAKANTSLADAIENIDIGGVALIRAAAKNHARVSIICQPTDYPTVLQALQTQGSIGAAARQQLAVKAFAHTAHYDTAIHRYLAQQAEQPLDLQLTAHPVQTLRYGENPHQTATLYSWQAQAGPLGGTLLQGKALSYNNLLDLDAAWQSVVRFDTPTVVIVKHLSPCGIASANTLAQAFPSALASDPISAFGGVIACNRPLDGETVQAFGDLFIECIAAPGYSPEARALLAKRKNCRLVDMPNLQIEPRWEVRSVTGGILQQSLDLGDPSDAHWQVVSQRQPTAAEWQALRFAWLACQTVRSNAIVLARSTAAGSATVGIGGGQPNRVDCVRIAAQKAGEQAHGAVLASDAFFPFPDSLQVAAAAGVTAAIHPGGSVRDSESIAAADAAGMALVITGVRHFRH